MTDILQLIEQAANKGPHDGDHTHTGSQSPMNGDSFVHLDQQYDRIQKVLSDYVEGTQFEGVLLDEIAIMFTTECGLVDYVMNAVTTPGVEHFNAAVDEVHTMPIPSGYMVRYDFLRLPERAYRLECMALLAGHSPIHHTIAHFQTETTTAHIAPAVVHASFKVPDGEAYREVLRVFAQHGAAPAMMCKSTYGEFCYIPVRGLDGTNVYLKPRVNLRDIDADE